MRILDMTNEDLAERLLIEVVDYKDSKANLLNFPYVKKGSFAVLAQLCVGEKNLDNNYSSVLSVTNDMLNAWGITKQEMFDMAVENSTSLFPAVVRDVSDFVDLNSIDGFFDDFDLSNVKILSNVSYFNGASVMFYPNILDRVCEEFVPHANELYILPSSVNHLYVLPFNEHISQTELDEIFQSMSEKVEDNQRLSEHIIVYNSTAKELREMDGTTYDTDLVVANNKSRTR